MRKILFPLLLISGFLLIWHLITALGVVHSALLPSPLEVLASVVVLQQKGLLLGHIGASLFRVFGGFVLAALFAIPLGIVMGWSRSLHGAFDPLLQIIRPISPIAWIPLAILWFGIGNKPAIFIIFITAFFPIFIGTVEATKNVDSFLIKAARNFGARGIDLFRKVIFPAIFPEIMTSLRIALGISWVIIVAAEMVGMRSGLGYLILDARNFLQIDTIVAGMIIIGLIGLVLDRMMKFGERLVRKNWGEL